MGFTIVSGNKPSSIAQHQNHAIAFIEMICFKSQYAKNQVGGPTINNTLRSEMTELTCHLTHQIRSYRNSETSIKK